MRLLYAKKTGFTCCKTRPFRNDTWVSPRALEAETTGYFLVPAGKLPAGWRAVSSERKDQNMFGAKGQIALKDHNFHHAVDDKKNFHKCPPPAPHPCPKYFFFF